MIFSFFLKYSPVLTICNLVLVGIVGMVAQWQYSKYMQDARGTYMPRVTLGNRTSGLLIGLYLVFTGQSGLPGSLKFILFIYRLLWLTLVANVIFWLFVWEKYS